MKSNFFKIKNLYGIIVPVIAISCSDTENDQGRSGSQSSQKPPSDPKKISSTSSKLSSHQQTMNSANDQDGIRSQSSQETHLINSGSSSVPQTPESSSKAIISPPQEVVKDSETNDENIEDIKVEALEAETLETAAVEAVLEEEVEALLKTLEEASAETLKARKAALAKEAKALEEELLSPSGPMVLAALFETAPIKYLLEEEEKALIKAALEEECSSIERRAKKYQKKKKK